MAEKEKATPPTEMNNERALEVALELLRPLRGMYGKVLNQARSMGIVIGPNEIVPIQFPFRQLELVSGVVADIKDGLEKGSWDLSQHKQLYHAAEQLQRIEQQEFQSSPATKGRKLQQ